MSKAVWIGLIVWAALMAGGYYWWQQRQAPDAPAPVAAPAALPADDEPEVVQYPLAGNRPESEPLDADDEPPTPAPEAAEPPPPEPLPELAKSDDAASEAATEVFGQAPVEAFLIPDRVFERTVVWLNSLDGRAVPLRFRSARHTQGLFAVEKQGDRLLISPENSARYDAMVAAFTAADPKLLVDAYQRYYPLLQDAYSDLGVRPGYFNDRLIKLIDHLLAAPEIDGPIEVVRPKVLYRYADAGLESLSSGQKMMIRLGPTHAREVKAQLRKVRAEIIKRRADD